MTIRHSNGSKMQAILLARTENTMRVAIEDSDDVSEFHEINGTWVSQDCEPVEIEFAWMRHGGAPVPNVNDCICSHELASRLVQMLFSGERNPESAVAASGSATASAH